MAKIFDCSEYINDFRNILNSMSEGFALHEIILDNDGKPVNYRFLEVNTAFESITGLKKDKILGRTVLDFLPGLEPFYVETYGKVALTGEPAQFESYAEPLGKFFRISAYCPKQGHFITIHQAPIYCCPFQSANVTGRLDRSNF